MLTHPFKDKCNIDDLLDDCVTIDRFCNRLELQAKELEEKLGPELGPNAAAKFKGDGLECLVEFWIKSGIRSNFLNIRDYTIITNDDTGVDGRGISTLNERVKTIQVKYRSNPMYELTANDDHLTNFGFTSIVRYGVKPEDTHNMLIITTGKDINYYTKENMLLNKVQIIGRATIASMLDGQLNFWNSFKQALLDSRIITKEIEKIVLRQHQKEAVDSVIKTIKDGKSAGYVELPTGTGKTWVQAEIIRQTAVQGIAKCFVIFSPRILLSFQILKMICSYLRSHGVDAEYLNVNSGGFNDEEINKLRLEAGFEANQVHSTTNSNEIYNIYNAALKANKPLIISSTYHSADKIQNSKIKVDIQLNDEAHHLVSEEFSKFAKIGCASFSFTATPKDTYSGQFIGMNNVGIFGERIYYKTPREMIDEGEMLRPFLHIIRAGGKHSDNPVDVWNCIVDAFAKHRKQIQDKSCDPNKIGAKLLVTLNGQKTLEGIIKSEEFEKFQNDNPDIVLMALSSDVGVYHNGKLEECSNRAKKELFDELSHKLSDTQQAIILYVDMLGEGIDVPGITAYMPIRGLGDSTFKQGIGRACRLQHEDRKKLYQKILKPDQHSRYIKPFAWVIVPDLITGSEDNLERYWNLLQMLYDEYGFEHECLIIDDSNGKDKEEIEDSETVKKDQKQSSKEEIEKLVHEYFEEIDRPMDIHDMAFIDIINSDACLSSHELTEKIFDKVKVDLKDQLKDYKFRALRRLRIGDDYLKMITRAKKKHNGVFAEEIKNKFGTIYTPEFVVEKTCELAFKYIPKEADLLSLTYCDPACYSDDTEVLTDTGWKFFKDLQDNDLIYSLNPITKDGEYVRFIARQIKEHKGIMHHYNGKRFDLLVTPDHSMYVESRLKTRHNNRFIKSSDLFKSNSRGNTVAFVAAAPLQSYNGKVGWNEDHYRLFGLWLGDGYIFKNNSKQHNAFGFGVVKPREINCIVKCLENLNFPYTTGIGKDGKTWFRVVDKDFLSFISPLDGTHNKYIPREIIFSSKHLLEALIDGLMNSDGSTSVTIDAPSIGERRILEFPVNRQTYYSSNKRLAEDVQRVAIHMGVATNFHMRMRPIHSSIPNIMIPCYEVSLGARRDKSVRKKLPPRSVSEQFYTNNVYCITLERNHIMLVRRNGKSVFCGNCGDGNFLIYLYHRLMKVENELKPIEKSEHILTKCLFGLEILKPMHLACKLRLLNEHLKLGGDLRIFDKLNISWGNTIMVPEDVGKWEIKEYEGGLLPEEIRNRKYDVIVGNPPYTRLTNLENRIYKAYPKQRDMAQIFVRWGLDHKDGVISFNITDAWFRYKLQDGAKTTRSLIYDKVVEVLQNKDITNYSKGDGGDIGTFIITINGNDHKTFIANNREISSSKILITDSLQIDEQRSWIHKRSSDILHEHRHCANKFNVVLANSWNEFLYKDDNGNNYFILVKKHLTNKTNGNFKLIRTDDVKKFLDKFCCGQPKYIEIPKELGLWLFGFLNSKTGRDVAFSVFQGKLPGNYEISSRAWKSIDFPDFDFYKANHLDKFTTYMKWIEDNMGQKDVFLLGIDEQFQKLIGE